MDTADEPYSFMHCTKLDWELPNTLKRIWIENEQQTDLIYTKSRV